MSDRIAGLGNVGGGLPTGSAVPQKPAEGTYQSERVVATTAQSVLDDAKEEITFAAREHMDERDLGDWEVKEPEGSVQLEQVQRIEEYLEKLPDIDHRRMREMIAELKQRGGATTQDELQRRLQSFHGDISYQQAALSALADELEREGGDPDLLATVRAALAANARDLGPQIRAGLNVTATALAEAGPGEAQKLRDLYRGIVLGHESIHKSFANLVERYGSGDLGPRIAYLLRAIGADLTSRGPSIPAPELKLILDDMHQLETLATIRERLIDTLARMQARFGVPRGEAAR